MFVVEERKSLPSFGINPPPLRSFKERAGDLTLSFLLHTPYRPTPYLDKQQGVEHCVRIKY
jgi:hypothetical protein